MTADDRLTLYPTADGSTTFFSDLFQEAFHSKHGAKREAEAKFVIPARICEKARTQQCVRILDVCYGLGYNSAAVIEGIGDRSAVLEIMALESNLQVPRTAIAAGLTDIWSPRTREVLQTLAENLQVDRPSLSIHLAIGDARQTILEVPERWADAIFLDPFSPPRCPQLWTVEFIQLLANCLKPDGYLVTYSCAAAIRTALLAAGLSIGATAPVGRRSPGTIAAFPPIPVPPLSLSERELLVTRASIPYRDPNLSDSAAVILERRQIEQALSALESTSNWKRRRQEKSHARTGEWD